jgi:uncharacterized protein YjbI with pentapeptide repeats
VTTEPASGQPARLTSAAPSEGTAKSAKRMPLLRLVAIGTVAVTLVGAGLFAWLAWLQSRQPAPLRGDSGWWDWLEHADGAALFDAARTTATLLAVVGVGGAALVAYRRQDTAERSHQVAIDSQRIATDQLELDSKKYDLDRERHTLETHRRADDQERELRARFTTVAEQLGSGNSAVRHAGAYALASLADDWQRQGKTAERQVCVDLLSAQLRRPRPTNDLQSGARRSSDEPAQDLEVRKTIVALIRSHRALNADDSSDDWNSCAIDLSGADLSAFDFNDTNLRGANLDDANLSFTQLVRADLSGAKMARTTLSGTNFHKANLTEASLVSSKTVFDSESDFWSSRARFEGAILRGAWFTEANLRNADFHSADLTGARLAGAQLLDAGFDAAILTKARFNNAKLGSASFRAADVRGAIFTSADLFKTNFDGAQADDETRWPHGQIPARLAPREAPPNWSPE